MTSRGAVVVVGEALVDLLAPSGGEISYRTGGGPFNAARTIGRLGEPVTLLAGLSNDRFGQEMVAQLAADGVELSDLPRLDVPTTLALAELDGHGQAEYRFYVDGTSAPAVEPGAALKSMPPICDVLHVGTLGLVIEPLATTVEALVEGADPQTLIVVDPNCRPRAVPDPKAFRARVQRVLARADVVKASDEDLAFLFPDDAPAASARALAAAGAVVLLSRGAQGADVHIAGQSEEVSAPPVTIVDTVGAGDALLGAFVAEWRRLGLGRDHLREMNTLLEVTRFAIRVASDTCTRAGADPPRRADLGQ